MASDPVKQYVVKKGDTLSGIAARECHDVKLVWFLTDLNGLKSADLIFVGQGLTIIDRGPPKVTATKNTRTATARTPSLEHGSPTSQHGSVGTSGLARTAGPARSGSIGASAPSTSGSNQKKPVAAQEVACPVVCFDLNREPLVGAQASLQSEVVFLRFRFPVVGEPWIEGKVSYQGAIEAGAKGALGTWKGSQKYDPVKKSFDVADFDYELFEKEYKVAIIKDVQHVFGSIKATLKSAGKAEIEMSIGIQSTLPSGVMVKTSSTISTDGQKVTLKFKWSSVSLVDTRQASTVKLSGTFQAEITIRRGKLDALPMQIPVELEWPLDDLVKKLQTSARLDWTKLLDPSSSEMIPLGIARRQLIDNLDRVRRLNSGDLEAAALVAGTLLATGLILVAPPIAISYASYAIGCLAVTSVAIVK